MQAKRIQVNESNLGAGSSVTVVLAVPSDPREEVNFHNIWAGVSVEPQDAAANCQGTWVLYILRGNTTAVTATDANINNEIFNTVIIGCGVFSAANESPWTSEPIHPSTSRTLQAGDSLALVCTVTGITAGLASARVMLCAHTTRK